MSVTDHRAVFGPMPSLGDVWQGVLDTVRTWLPTYLRERERLSGRDYGSLPRVRGWRTFTSELDWLPGDQLPLCVLVSPGLSDVRRDKPGGLVSGTVDVSVSIVVSSRNAQETLDLATDYGAALRACLEQHADLGGLDGAALYVTGERYDDLDTTDQQTILAARVTATVQLDAVTDRSAGPPEPEGDPPPEPVTPEPEGPSLGTVETTSVLIQREPLP